MSPTSGRIAFGFASRAFAFIFISFALITSGFSADGTIADAPSIAGNWKFNLRNSNMANMPAPGQATLAISMHENKLTWREAGTSANGKRFEYTFDGPIDGRPHSLKGRLSRITISFTRKNGAIVGRWVGKGKRLSIAKVSDDGMSLAIENVSNVYNMVSNWITSWDRVLPN